MKTFIKIEFIQRGSTESGGIGFFGSEEEGRRLADAIAGKIGEVVSVTSEAIPDAH